MARRQSGGIGGYAGRVIYTPLHVHHQDFQKNHQGLELLQIKIHGEV